MIIMISTQTFHPLLALELATFSYSFHLLQFTHLCLCVLECGLACRYLKCGTGLGILTEYVAIWFFLFKFGQSTSVPHCGNAIQLLCQSQSNLYYKWISHAYLADVDVRFSHHHGCGGLTVIYDLILQILILPISDEI